MKQILTQRIIPLLLVLAMLMGFAVPVGATNPQSSSTQTNSTQSLDFTPLEDEELALSSLEEQISVDELTEKDSLYEATDIVRVSIMLDDPSTLDAGFSTLGISANAEAMAYRDGLKDTQTQITARIESALKQELDVAWNLTLAANLISANVEYGQIETIENIPGVESVILETRYEPVETATEEASPLMASAATMTGTDTVWASGYSGAGTRIAVIDTGIDTDHQSFSAEGYLYSLAYQAGLKGEDAEEYIESLNLLDIEEVLSVQDKLNVTIDPNLTYVSEKIPFAYNYIDVDYDVTHDNDAQGGHGSHVEGIAAANAFIPNGDGTFSNALTSTHVQGVAPDAQILVMKVFGKAGGAYDSDYMAAIEDAIILGCDSVNLSLGSASPGFSYSVSYQALLDNLANTDTVVSIAAGNAYSWATYSMSGVGYLYADDVNFSMLGSPGSFINSLTVASAQNSSERIMYIQVGDTMITYNQSSYSNAPIKTIAGDYQYVLIDGIGTAEDWDAVGSVLEGKVAVCSRGTTSFAEKANLAVEHGAVAVIIYNNTEGSINMDLTDYLYTKPVISITQAFGAVMRNAAKAVADGSGNTLYYLGDVFIAAEPGVSYIESDYVTMNSFSSWGVAGSLVLKPEISAPGGSIYSVDGTVADGKSYVTNSGTSMAAPHVAGLAALMAQYIRENNLEEKTGESPRHLINSLLMSTSTPEIEEASGSYWSVMKQGSGLANVNNAITAGTYIMMGEDATASWADGKVKAELGDDPERTGEYSFTFTVNNFSDIDKSYTLTSDFFTQGTFEQDGRAYLDTKTTPIAADVVYLVDGKIFRPTGTLACDLNGDAITDAADAQLILEYCAGNLNNLGQQADVSGDGVISTYDAHMILNNLETQAFTVKPGESVTVEVQAAFSKTTKEWLNETYVNGAYVEGYVFAEPVTTEEGDIGVTHSIPVLGFYGGWSEASMFEKTSYWEAQYGDTTPNYSGEADINVMYICASDSAYAVAKQANPYMIEDDIPTERLAIRSTDQLYMIPNTTIRPASAFVMASLHDDGTVNTVLVARTQEWPAFYYASAGQWTNTHWYNFVVTHVGNLGVKEGDNLNFSHIAIPEYYLPTVNATTEEMVKVINSGVLDDGAYLTTTFVVDDTAPELLGVTKDLLTGSLEITATDANYIASLQVLSADGLTTYASVLPEATERGQVTTTTLNLGQYNVGAECIIALGDYAGNEVFYKIAYGGDPIDEVGGLYFYTTLTDVLETSGWYKVDPDQLWYYNGIDNGGIAKMGETANLTINYATYADGKVFVAASDGNFYVTNHGTWDTFDYVGTYSGVISSIYGMAYNPVDGLIYVTSTTSNLYTLNPYTGEFVKAYTVSLKYTRGGPPIYKYPRAIAITSDGTFYVTNWGNGSSGSYVYTFTLDDVIAGTTIEPINAAGLGVSTSSRPTLAWNEAEGMLYLTVNIKTEGDYTNILYAIDPEEGIATLANPNTETYGSYASCLYVPTQVMYTVSDTEGSLKSAKEATGIELNYTELNVLQGATTTLKATLTPWNLEDTSVRWASSNSSVASVDENGLVTAVNPGTATITATTNASPNLTAQCTITVEAIPEIGLSAQVTDETGTYWVDFTTTDPAGYTRLAESELFTAGAIIDDELFDDELLVYKNARMYGIDMDSFEIISDYGYLEVGWYWSDAAICPTTKEGYFGGVATITHRGRYFMVETPSISDEEYWVLTDMFREDPMALLAYMETSTYQGYPATYYKVLTEGGILYDLILLTRDQGATYEVGLGKIGATGINIKGAAYSANVAYGSMVYDAASGYLVAAVSPKNEGSSLYFIDPTTAITTCAGSFGDDVWPVTTLNQYQRASELSLLIDRSETSLYIGDSTTLSVKVRPANYTGGVTWVSSNENVATVDANGVVTAIAEGTATITATSEDVNAEGKPATITCDVTVKPLASLDTVISAQVETADGLYWMDIDLGDMTTTVQHTADVKYIGGGYANGFIYGSVGDLVDGGWQHATYLDQDYTSVRYWYGPFNASSMILDGTNAPAATFVYRGKTYSVFGTPAYLSGGMVGVCKNADPIGSRSTAARGMDLSTLPGIGTFAFYDWSYQRLSGSTTGVPVYEFLSLSTTGTLYKVIVKGDPNDSFTGYYLNFSYTTVGNVGMTFKDYTALSMTTVRDPENGVNGLIVSDSSYGKVSFYYIDMNAETLECAKIGDLEGATDLSCMYNDFSKITDLNQVPQADNNGSATESPAAITDMVLYTAGGSDELAEADAVYADTMDAEENENVEIEKGTVELTLNSTEDMTNGIVQVTYDRSVLTYEGITSPMANTAVRVKDGVITFDFASAYAVSVESVLATVSFSYDASCIDTEVTVSTVQSNTENEVSDVSVTYDIVYNADGHTWEVTESQAPTCFTEGYEVLVCSVCGATTTNVLEPNNDCCPSKNFTDLDINEWYHEGIDFVLTNGLMNGMSETIFAPGGTLTRAQVVTVLYRLAGEPETTDLVNPFADVADDMWFTEAIIWAASEGIVKGMTETVFAPNEAITREQLATILYRYAGAEAVEDDFLKGFEDVTTVSDYAVDAMNWAVAVGLIEGVSDTELSPKTTATRAQYATILMRFLSE